METSRHVDVVDMDVDVDVEYTTGIAKVPDHDSRWLDLRMHNMLQTKRNETPLFMRTPLGMTDRPDDHISIKTGS